MPSPCVRAGEHLRIAPTRKETHNPIKRRAVNTPHPPCPTVPLLLKEKAMTSALFSFRRNISSAKHISSNRRLHIEFARQTYRKSKGFIQNGMPSRHALPNAATRAQPFHHRNVKWIAPLVHELLSRITWIDTSCHELQINLHECKVGMPFGTDLFLFPVFP